MDKAALEESVKAFFPYPGFRPHQLELISFAYRVFKSGRIGLVSSPCGTGKSISVLTAYLMARSEGYAGRLLALTRTKNQLEIYCREIKRVKEYSGLSITAAMFKSKREMCPRVKLDAKLKDVSYHDFLRYCRGLKSGAYRASCQFYENTLLNGWKPTGRARAVVDLIVRRGPLMPNEVYSLCESYGLCPYEVTKLLSSRADLIVGSYNYALLTPIRSSIMAKARLKPLIVDAVFDEAHSLPRYAIDILSDELSTRSMRMAEDEARNYGVKGFEVLRLLARKVVGEGRKALSRVKLDEEALISRDKLTSWIIRKAKLKGLDDLLEQLSFLEDEGERIRHVKVEEGKAPTSYLARCASFLADWIRATPPAYVHYVKAVEGVNGETYWKLGLKCLDSSSATSIVNRFRSAILMSGTLWGFDYYVEVLGLDKARVSSLSLPYPFPRENRLILVDLSSTSKYEKRCDELWAKIASRLTELLKAIGGRVAVYTPSYEVLKAILGRLKVDRPAIVEEEHTRIDEVIEKVKAFNECVVFGVAGGKLSEGVDITDDKGRGLLSAVVIVGLPYPKKTEVHEALINYYKDRFGARAMEYANEAPCINTLAQTAGRLIRGPEDKGFIVLMDYRAAKPRFKEKLPSDWREDLRCHRSVEKLVVEVQQAYLKWDKKGRVN